MPKEGTASFALFEFSNLAQESNIFYVGKQPSSLDGSWISHVVADGYRELPAWFCLDRRVTDAKVTRTDGQEMGDLAPEAFDAILLDAPCSCEGNVRKEQWAFVASSYWVNW